MLTSLYIKSVQFDTYIYVTVEDLIFLSSRIAEYGRHLKKIRIYNG